MRQAAHVGSRPAPHQVPQVQLGHLQGADVLGGHAACVHAVQQGGQLSRGLDAGTPQHLGGLTGRVSILELCDWDVHPCTGQHVDEVQEGPRVLGDGGGEGGLGAGAHVGQLRDQTQPLKVDVGPAGDGDHGLTLEVVALDPGLGTCHTQSTCRLKDGPGLIEHVLDGCADGAVVHQDDSVHQLAAQPERLHANLLDCHSVSKGVHLGQHHTFAPGQADGHGVGTGGLHTNDLDVGF
mmetsp:Transcript_30774/g.68188  ORF Transcript_30774/g.68188 Transcript_30774/m.68188 type:complete len:237 (-) Transcript_30774:1144-1854(-)